MSSPTSHTSPSTPQSPPEVLEVPAAPRIPPAFVLPPPPSDLLNRLQAFLPQIRDANEQLAGMELGENEEEVVVLEELSDSDSDDSSSSSSSEEDSSSEEEEEEQVAGIGGIEEADPTESPAPGLQHLLDISARPKVLRKDLSPSGGEKKAGIVEMEETQ